MVLVERIDERLRRYADRDPSVIYVHMLDVNVHEVVSRPPEYRPPLSGWLRVGELIHAAVEAILEPAPPRCETVDVYVTPVPEAAARFVHRGEATVCGTADAVADGYVVEVKTTAKRNGRPYARWKRRAFHYAALYAAPAVLVVIDRVTGAIEEIVVDPPRDPKRFLRWAVNKWLAGEYPEPSLDRFVG